MPSRGTSSNGHSTLLGKAELQADYDAAGVRICLPGALLVTGPVCSIHPTPAAGRVFLRTPVIGQSSNDAAMIPSAPRPLNAQEAVIGRPQ